MTMLVAFRDFQLALKAPSNRGVQLAISSKNDEKLAMDAIDNHPEMILKKKTLLVGELIGMIRLLILQNYLKR